MFLLNTMEPLDYSSPLVGNVLVRVSYKYVLRLTVLHILHSYSKNYALNDLKIYILCIKSKSSKKALIQ